MQSAFLLTEQENLIKTQFNDDSSHISHPQANVTCLLMSIYAPNHNTDNFRVSKLGYM